MIKMFQKLTSAALILGSNYLQVILWCVLFTTWLLFERPTLQNDTTVCWSQITIENQMASGSTTLIHSLHYVHNNGKEAQLKAVFPNNINIAKDMSINMRHFTFFDIIITANSTTYCITVIKYNSRWRFEVHWESLWQFQQKTMALNGMDKKQFEIWVKWW